MTHADTYDTKLKFTLPYLRKENYPTQEAAAEAFGVSRRTWIRWETGEAEPNQETLVRLAKFFNVELDYVDLTAENTANKAKQIIAEQVEHLSRLPVEAVTHAERSWLIRVVKLLQPNTLVEEKITLHQEVEPGKHLEKAMTKVTQLTGEQAKPIDVEVKVENETNAE